MDTISISVPYVATRKKAGKSRRPALTEADTAAARALKARWLAIPKAIRPTQDQMATMWTDASEGETQTQSGISQYLNGHIPLNITAAIRFAAILRCKPMDILDVPELHDMEVVPVTIFRKSSWPFSPLIPEERIRALTLIQLARLEGSMLQNLRDIESGQIDGTGESAEELQRFTGRPPTQ